MRALVAAVTFFVAFLALGFFVSSRPPGAFDANELGAFGLAIPFAAFGRAAGQFPVYATLCTLGLVFGAIRRAYLSAALLAIVLMLATWKTSDLFKDIFHRARPEHWLVVHETSAAYPSGHATLSLAFFGFAAYVAWRSPLPAGVRRVLVALCTFWVLAIGWSRLALGAHYPTDVIGGYALGAAGVCLAAAAYERYRDRSWERLPVRTRSRYTR